MKSNQFEYPRPFRALLQKRGLSEESEIHNFLYPKLSDLPPPDKMKNLPEAAEIVADFVKGKRQIVIWGDYDVDGTTGTSLLVNFFKKINIDVIWHIPNRLTEGYGLHVDWFIENISSFSSKNFLLITVDCGISNHKEIMEIQRLGGEVIVTDHHSIPQDSVPCCTVLNPEQQGCGFRKEKLAGVGVAFYLAAGVRSALSKINSQKQLAEGINLKQFLGFVALGTVADMVDLTPTNRILVRGGMEALVDTEFKGLRLFLKACDTSGDSLTSEDIGYLLGPKINAAGRLGKSLIAVEIFTDEDEAAITKKISRLQRLNEKRKGICDEDFEMALDAVNHEELSAGKCCFVFGDYHPGVAGIVASRLVEKFGVPAFVLAESNGMDGTITFKGSARSIDGIDLMPALHSCSSSLLKYGGHSMAAGLAVAADKVEEVLAALSSSIKKQLERRLRPEKRLFDLECGVDQVMDNSMLKLLSLMEPFGPLNPQPIFLDSSARIVNSKAVGRGAAHLNVTVRGKYSNYKGVGFRLGGFISEVQRRPERTLLYTPTKNRFRGTVSWQLRILDL